MSGTPWISDLFSNYDLGYKLGLRQKYHGRDWTAPRHEVTLPGERIMAALDRYRRGFAIDRNDMPEALAVFDKGRFARVADIFYAGPFCAVKGKVAEIFADMDLGDGGLIKLPIYDADLVTPLSEDFHILAFGCRKQSFLPDQSSTIVPRPGTSTWRISGEITKGSIALSSAALDGPDLWFEEALLDRIFMSDRLGQRLEDAGFRTVFELTPCRIGDGAPA